MESSKLETALTILTFLICRSMAISTHDLDGVLTLLRAQGHMLFANAIATSDLLFDILSLENLTLLAPTDPTVFALDMTNAPLLYISTLRLHVLPVRLSWSEIRLLSNGSLLPTFSPVRQLRVVRYQEGHNHNLLVVDGDGGVEVVMPGLYYSANVAVHALGGILTFRSKLPTTNPSNGGNTIEDNNVTISLTPSPQSVPISNDTFPSPTPSRITAVFNDTSNHTLLPRCLRVEHAPSPSTFQSLPVHPPSPSPTPSQSLSPFPALAPENDRDEVLPNSMCVVE